MNFQVFFIAILLEILLKYFESYIRNQNFIMKNNTNITFHIHYHKNKSFFVFEFPFFHFYDICMRANVTKGIN